MLAFREGPADGDEPREALPRREVAERLGGGALACSACRARITTRGAAIAIGGSHEHRCENPHGYRYTIGCFAAAEGLVAVGTPSLEWTWFPGHTWQVQNCAVCDDLLGWRFQASQGGFFGLIVMRLVELS